MYLGHGLFSLNIAIRVESCEAVRGWFDLRKHVNTISQSSLKLGGKSLQELLEHFIMSEFSLSDFDP
jgi:hypothetical protein